jgi:opacity protein-like surface antigen
MRHLSITIFTAALVFIATRDASGQAFISPSVGYHFGNNVGCLAATDCENKSWNLGISVGALGSIVGFDAEFTYEDDFLGDTSLQQSTVMTFMGNFMLAPKFGFLQPYGLAGLGVIRTDVETTPLSESENQVGWSVGGGLIVFFGEHIGLKGDVRYYHSFEVFELLGIDFGRDRHELDFGRAGFGVIFKF